MPATTRTAARSPYPAEQLSVKIQRSKLGAAWRWRTELLAFAAGITAWVKLAAAVGVILAAVIITVTLAGLLGVPHSRRFLAARCWCLYTRHRLQRAFWEMRLHTRAGHLPLMLWLRGTPVGVRAYVLACAGTSLGDYENAAPVLAAACAAREARVANSARWSHLIIIDILRRDLLGSRRVVGSHLPRMTGPVLVPLPSAAQAPADRDPREAEPGEAAS